jgi:hypothetical protein
VSLPVVLRDEAWAEFDEAFDWYESQWADLGPEFAAEVQKVFDRIAANPPAPSGSVRGATSAIRPRSLQMGELEDTGEAMAGEPTVSLDAMSDHYRKVRKAVYEEATAPSNGSTAQHTANKQLFRGKVTELCNRADLGLYRGNDEAIAHAIWRHLWTINRYAGIRAAIASAEIRDIEFIFDQYTNFISPSWDIQARGHTLIQSGSDVRHFLDRTGQFTGRQTIGNLPKLQKIVNLARRLKSFLDTRAPDRPVLHFITNGMSEDDVWAIHSYLLSLGYTADLTALHFMMDMGFQVIKPDIIISRLFLEWGWLRQILPKLPANFSASELQGKGNHGVRFKYTAPTIYKPVIDLARQIVRETNQKDLIADIGWATNNPLREFDIFIVKYGQQPQPSMGIVRTLRQLEWTDGGAVGTDCPSTNPDQPN